MFKDARPVKQCTLCVVVSDGKILLGLKKRGFGAGKYNGYGGKVQPGEGIREAALREFIEESCLQASLDDMVKVGEIDFHFPQQPAFDQTVHIYKVKSFSGELKETEEMSHHWFDINNIPYANMWDDDKHWLPLVLNDKMIQGHFVFKELNGENVVDQKSFEVIDQEHL